MLIFRQPNGLKGQFILAQGNPGKTGTPWVWKWMLK